MYEFQLSPNAKAMEGHLTWMEEMLPYLEMTAFLKAPTFEEYLNILLTQEAANRITNNGVDVDQEGKTTDNCHIIHGYVAMQLNVAAFRTYLGELEAAEEILEDARIASAAIPQETIQARAFAAMAKHYFQVAKRQILEIRGVQRERGREREEFGGGREIPGVYRLNQIHKRVAFGSNSMGAMWFFKGCLGAALKINDVAVLERFKKAIEICPLEPYWYHFAYRKARRIRRNSLNAFDGPSSEERNFCKEAYKLAPTDPVILLDCALYLKETLWYKPASYWLSHPEKVRICVDKFKKALAAIESQEMWNKKRWTRKATIYYGEFLLFGKGRGLDRKKGKDLLDSCYAEYPKCTTLLHKLAKLYHRGVPGTRQYQDLEKAKENYAFALNGHPTNYPCLIDYLKLLCSEKKYREVITTIDNFLALSIRDADQLSLLIDRGFIIWMYDPFENSNYRLDACKSWVRAVTKFPTKVDEVYDAVSKPYKVAFLYQSDMMQIHSINIVDSLKVLKESMWGGDEYGVINHFIVAMEKLGQNDSDSLESSNEDCVFRGRLQRMNISNN